MDLSQETQSIFSNSLHSMPALSYRSHPGKFKSSSGYSMSKIKSQPSTASICKGIRSLTGNVISLLPVPCNQQINAQRIFNCSVAQEFALLRHRFFSIAAQIFAPLCHRLLPPSNRPFSPAISLSCSPAFFPFSCPSNLPQL